MFSRILLLFCNLIRALKSKSDPIPWKLVTTSSSADVSNHKLKVLIYRQFSPTTLSSSMLDSTTSPGKGETYCVTGCWINLTSKKKTPMVCVHTRHTTHTTHNPPLHIIFKYVPIITHQLEDVGKRVGQANTSLWIKRGTAHLLESRQGYKLSGKSKRGGEGG